MFEFDGFSWKVAEIAAASCSDFADCPMAWNAALHFAGAAGLGLVGLLSRQVGIPGEGVRGGDVRLRDVAVVPLLSTRTGVFSFEAPFWAVRPSAKAS